jgi:hypothetical protein
MSCGRIDKGSSPDCDNLPEGGTRARLILINWDDVRFVFESNGVITSIELYPGKVAYEFLGFRDDVGKSDDVVSLANLKNRFRHSTSFVIYENDQPQKTNIKNITKGRFLAITETLGHEDSCIEVLGKECGLAIVGGVIRNAHENSGMFTINLSTPDNGVEFERKLPQNLGTTYEDGLTIIDGLLNNFDDWILKTGFWDDTGFWRDSKIWID